MEKVWILARANNESGWIDGCATFSTRSKARAAMRRFQKRYPGSADKVRVYCDSVDSPKELKEFNPNG